MHPIVGADTIRPQLRSESERLGGRFPPLHGRGCLVQWMRTPARGVPTMRWLITVVGSVLPDAPFFRSWIIADG